MWFTGLPGSGKSTLATHLEQRLFDEGYQTYMLDGDNVRNGLNRDLGFSPEDRTENIRRIGEVAALFAEAGTVVVTAFISPYQADRRKWRGIQRGTTRRRGGRLSPVFFGTVEAPSLRRQPMSQPCGELSRAGPPIQSRVTTRRRAPARRSRSFVPFTSAQLISALVGAGSDGGSAWSAAGAVRYQSSSARGVRARREPAPRWRVRIVAHAWTGSANVFWALAMCPRAGVLASRWTRGRCRRSRRR